MRQGSVLSRRASADSVPVILIAGFLGSGKTTLLNHLLRNSGGTRIGLVVNDFGAVNIDALLVAGQVDGLVGLGNGCMCCTIDDDDDTEDGLAAVVDKLLTAPGGVDVIVIEASGLAEPRALVQMVAGLTDRRLRYGGLVYVVDASEFEGRLARHRQVSGHVALADLVVANKTDLIDEHARDALVDVLSQLNRSAPIVHVVDAAVDPALLFELSDPVDADETLPRQLSLDELLLAADDDCATHRHLHDDYQSVSFECAAPLNPRRLARFLERPPAGVYRVKGMTHFVGDDAGGTRFVFHSVGGRVRAERLATDSGPGTSVVVIGMGIDESAVRDELTVCLHHDEADEFGLLSMTRYLV